MSDLVVKIVDLPHGAIVRAEDLKTRVPFYTDFVPFRLGLLSRPILGPWSFQRRLRAACLRMGRRIETRSRRLAEIERAVDACSHDLGLPTGDPDPDPDQGVT